VFLAVLLVGQNYPYSLMPIETGTPYLLSAAAHSQLLLTSASSSQVWTFPVEGNKKQIEWVPMQAPEYVGIYPVSTTPVDFDLGVTGITEIYIAPEDIVVVVFGKSGDDLSAANPMPIYPASPMRFKLGPASRRMRLIAAAPTNLTIAFIGRAD
jgi:hypothetical protein